MELTILGVILLVTLFVTIAQGKNSRMVTAFLGVVLLGMIVLNWARIRPLFIKGGGTP